MRYFFLTSPFRLAVWGLVIMLLLLWYFWFSTDQIVRANLPISATSLVLLNIALILFSYDRQPYLTRFLIALSYVIIILAQLSLYSLTKGLI